MRLAILGASGHGKVVADTALAVGWEAVDFFDDAWPERTQNGSWMVAGDTRTLTRRVTEFQGVVVGIGNNRIRLSKIRELQALGAPLISLVHPGAVVSSSVSLGAGCVVFAGAVIQADARLGDACIVNTLASVDHDCQLGDGVHVCPGAHFAGSVSVGETSWIGIGASVKQQVTIGANVTVGAGAAVVHDVPDGVIVVGVPARPIAQ